MCASRQVVRGDDKPVAITHPALQIITHDDKLREEDIRRTVAIKLDAFNRYLQHPENLQSSNGRLAAIKLYREILELAGGEREVFSPILPITMVNWSQTKKDTFFCIAMMSADREGERQIILEDWAATHVSIPDTKNLLSEIDKNGVLKSTKFKYLFGNRDTSSKLGNIYARIVLGTEKTKYLKELGIEHFLRYSPGTLEKTVDFFQGRMTAGEVNFAMYSKYDHNGAFNNNFIDFWEIGSKGGRVVVIEWDRPEKLVDGLTRFAEQLAAYKQQGKEFTLHNGILAGHGDVRSIGGAKDDNETALDVKDRVIFDQLSMLATKIKFKRLIINACSTLEEKDDPNFASIAEMIQLTGLTDASYASVRSIGTRLDYDKDGNIVARANDGIPAYKKLEEN
ncbi:MAG: hypothetical protein ABID61_06065 [Candidatus Micrarchaeota archaeon]